MTQMVLALFGFFEPLVDQQPSLQAYEGIY
jgi:hypothetical protein